MDIKTIKFLVDTSVSVEWVDIELYSDFKPGKPNPAHWAKALLKSHYEEVFEWGRPVLVVKGTCLDFRTTLLHDDVIELWNKTPESPLTSRKIAVNDYAHSQGKNLGITLGDILRDEENKCYYFALIRETMVIVSGM